MSTLAEIMTNLLTTDRAFAASCVIRPAYWTVVELSSVVLIGMPK